MKNIINKIVKSPLLIIVVVVVIISCIGTSYALGPYLYNSNEINYDNTESGLQSDNVQDAVDELFQHATDYTELKELLSVVNGLLENVKGNTTDNAGFHNSIFRGKDVTSYYTDGSLYTRISSGSFDDLYVGDYIQPGGTGTIWRIAGFDIYYGKGDPALTSHHAVIVPDTNLTNAMMNCKHNSSNQCVDDSNNVITSNYISTTEGGYVGSLMYKVTLPSVLDTYITPVFGNHVLTCWRYLTNSINSSLSNNTGNNSGASNLATWKSRQLDLMNENQLYGSIVWSSSGYEIGADNVQFPLFHLKPVFINKDRNGYWLRNVANKFHFVNNTYKSTAWFESSTAFHGVRPYFYID